MPKEKSESRSTETTVGVFVVLGLIVISILVFAIAEKQKLFEPRYRITALFSRVTGLKVGSPVRLAGLEVGSVESLDFTGNGRVLATFSIRARYQEQIRRDSTATISSVGILGDKSVEITVGSSDEEVIVANSRISTKDPFDVSDFVDQVAPMTAKIDEILSYLSDITGEFSMQDYSLAETMQSAESILKKVNRGEGTIGAAVNDPRLYRELVSLAQSGRETAEDLKKILSKVESASGDLPALIGSTRQAMEDVSAIATDLRAGARRLPEITRNVSEAAENLRDASRDLPAIAGSLREAGRGAEDVIQGAKKSWLIRGNLPKRPTAEESILLDDPSYSLEGTHP